MSRLYQVAHSYRCAPEEKKAVTLGYELMILDPDEKSIHLNATKQKVLFAL